VAENISEQKKKNIFSRRFLSRAGMVIVALIVLGGLIFVVFKYVQPASQKVETPQAREERLRQSVIIAAGSKDPAKTQDAIKEFDAAIGSTSDAAVKQHLLLDKANLYINSGDLVAAEKTALEADGVQHSVSSVWLLASIYEKQKNNAKAIEYYQLSLQYLSKDGPTELEYNEATMKIEQLKARQ